MSNEILFKSNLKDIEGVHCYDKDASNGIIGDGKIQHERLPPERITDMCEYCKLNIDYLVRNEDHHDNNDYVNHRRRGAIDLYNNTLGTIYSTINPNELRGNIRLRNNTKWNNTNCPVTGLDKSIASIGEVADRRFENWEYNIAVLISEIKLIDFIPMRCPHCNDSIKFHFNTNKYVISNSWDYADKQYKIVDNFIRDLRSLVESIYKTSDFSITRISEYQNRGVDIIHLDYPKPVHMVVPENDKSSDICTVETVKLD